MDIETMLDLRQLASGIVLSRRGSREMSKYEVITSEKIVDIESVVESYNALRNLVGADRVFLLESLAENSTDAQLSLIGVEPVLQLWNSGGKITIAGYHSVKNEVAKIIGDFPGASRTSAYSVQLRDQCHVWEALRLVRDLFRCGRSTYNNGFSFGFFGYFGYDIARSIEKLPYKINSSEISNDLSLGIYQGIIIIERNRDKAILKVHNSSLWPYLSCEDVNFWLKFRYDKRESIDHHSKNVSKLNKVKRTVKHNTYLKKAHRAKKHIGIGDIYQIQLGHEIDIQSTTAPMSVYMRLRERNPSPFMYIAQIGADTIIGASPELFVRVANGRITMRPIAGTIRRGKDKCENDAFIDSMINDEKEKAEHIMLVDLCRNDISRICKAGTLSVDSLMEVATYSHVNHLISTVSGKIDNNLDCFDIIKATFPAGTMTGAPKIRAMEIIEDLETSRRGIYSGVIGVIDFNGYVNMALCIRSAVLTGGRYRIRASAGIVADSVPEREWDETLSKMAAPYWAITGRELKNEGGID